MKMIESSKPYMFSIGISEFDSFESSKPYMFSIGFSNFDSCLTYRNGRIIQPLYAFHWDFWIRPVALAAKTSEDDEPEHGETPCTTAVTAGVPTRTQRIVSTARTTQPPCGMGPGHFSEHAVRSTHRGQHIFKGGHGPCSRDCRRETHSDWAVQARHRKFPDFVPLPRSTQ